MPFPVSSICQANTTQFIPLSNSQCESLLDLQKSDEITPSKIKEILDSEPAMSIGDKTTFKLLLETRAIEVTSRCPGSALASGFCSMHPNG